MQALEQQPGSPTLPPAGPAQDDQAQPKQWAIVEVMGHGRVAGAISQQVFGGANLVRVDVPAVTIDETTWRNGGDATTSRVIPAHSRSLGAAAIYSINWCDELAATVAAQSIKHEPISPYSLQRALAAMPVNEQNRLLALTAGNTINAGGDDDNAHGF